MTLDQKAKSLHAADWAIIAVYFILCIVVGLWSKFRKQRGKKETAESYFLAGRSMMWWAVGPSLFASNIGSEHFIGIAGSGAATGIGVVSYEWQACWVLLLLGWVFVPIYLKSRIYTMPEFMKKRFQSKWIRTVITFIALVSYVFTKTSVDIYAGSVFLYEAIGWNIYISSACILAITAVYTMLGGLMAVIFTDVLQCAIMLIGAIVLAIMSFVKVGGITGLWEKFPNAIGAPYRPSIATTMNTSLINATAAAMTTLAPTTGALMSNVTNHTMSAAVDACYKVTPYWGNMFRPLDDPDYPWLGVWTTLPIMGVWYWCTDQVIVQRAIGAKNNMHAKAGSIFAGFLKILPIFIMVMPGMISRVLFKDSIACADAASCKFHCGNEYGCSNNAYPKLVLNILPTGMVGLMMAVMMAALMSSLSSAFNSSATIFTVDVWDRFRPQASQREQLIVGRVCVFVLVIVSLCWLPIIQGSAGSQLFVYIQTVQSYLAPPLTMAFALGILWPRLTEAGALSGLAAGFLLGIIKFILGNIFPAPSCGEGQDDDRPAFVKMHFMFYAIIVFVVTGIVMVVVSFFTEPVPLEELGGLTWKTINDPPVAQSPTDMDVKELGGDVENGKVSHVESIQLIEDKKPQNGDAPQNGKPDVAEENAHLHEERKIRLEVVVFPEEPLVLKWFLRGATVALLCTLVLLWIVYR